MEYKDFYSELGKLLYAVADVDGVISIEEKKALHKIVKKELAPDEDGIDEFGTDLAYYTEFEFDVMEAQIATAEEGFNSFIDFVELHKSHFNNKLKNLTMRVANDLAKAYKGKNKKEEILLSKLKAKLDEL